MADNLFTAIVTKTFDWENLTKRASGTSRLFAPLFSRSQGQNTSKTQLSSKNDESLKNLIRTTVITELSIHFPLVAKKKIAKEAEVFVIIHNYFMNGRNANRIFGNNDENERADDLFPLRYLFLNYFEIVVSIYWAHPTEKDISGEGPLGK